jgi:IS4 transposase
LTLFPWAKFRQQKAAVKMHTLLDLRGNIPPFIRISDGKLHDVNILDELVHEPGAFYIMDRGYLDFDRQYGVTANAAFFVTRAKEQVRLTRRYSHPVDKAAGIRSDHTVVLTTLGSAKVYPDALRRIHYVDPETNKRRKFLTNNFNLPATVIALLYKRRWAVELFFEWIKQHLPIKAFFGTSENAVRSQTWIAISVFVLVAIAKKRLGLDASLFQILQVVSVTLFEKTPILLTFQMADSEDE